MKKETIIILPAMKAAGRRGTERWGAEVNQTWKLYTDKSTNKTIKINVNNPYSTHIINKNPIQIIIHKDK